jgi:hypothetical protein
MSTVAPGGIGLAPDFQTVRGFVFPPNRMMRQKDPSVIVVASVTVRGHSDT